MTMPRIRSWTCSCLALVTLMLAISLVGLSTVAAADPDRPLPQLQETRLPVAEIPPWLQKGWLPISSKEYDNWRSLPREGSNQPQQAWVERSVYSAVYVDGTLHKGTFTAEVKHLQERSQLLTMNPLNLAISELDWGDQPAVWGTTPAGQTAFWTNPEKQQLNGRWTLSGRAIARGVDFDVQLMPATINQIQIQTPVEHQLESSVGEVSRLPSENASGWIDWLVDLGSMHECHLTIRHAKKEQPARPIVLAESVLHCDLQPDGLSFVARFDLEVIGAPVNELQFLVPDDVQIESITYGGKGRLSFASRRGSNDENLIVVSLPDPLLDQSRPIRIAGTGTASIESTKTIPQVVLKDSLFVDGQLHLMVYSPLVLKSLSALRGYRQTAYVAFDGEGESFSFQQYRSDASLTIEDGYPQLTLSAKVVSSLRVLPESHILESEIHWETLSGSTFTTRCMIPAGWDIETVRSPTPRSDTQFRWESERHDDGRLLLTIEFPDALSPDNPIAVQIALRKLLDANSRNSSTPVISPQGCELVKQLIVLPERHTGTASLQGALIQGLMGFESIDATKIPDRVPFLYDTYMGKDLVETSQEALKFYYSSSADPVGSPIIDEEPVFVDALSTTTVTCLKGQLTEEIVLDVRPRNVPLSLLRVFIPESGLVSNWAMNSTAATSLTQTRLPVSRHREFGLPESGELWELRFLDPSLDGTEIRSTRVQSLTGKHLIALPYVLQTEDFRGTLQLNVDNVDHYQWQTTQLQVATTVESSFPSEKETDEEAIEPVVWTYRDSKSSFSIQSTDKSDDSHQTMLATLMLQSVLRCDGEGSDAHTATFTTSKTSQALPFSFQLPPTTTLVAVLVNGKPVSHNQHGQDYRLPVLPAQKQNQIEIFYLAPSVRSQLRTQQEIFVPRPHCEVVNFRWHCMVPPDLVFVDIVANSSSARSDDSFSWTERFFGPLGRKATETIFLFQSPQATESASANSLLDDLRSSERPNASTILPEGWNEVRLSHPVFPTQLHCSTGRRSLAVHWSWICLFFTLILGLSLRYMRLPQNSAVASVWISGCVFAAWLSSPLVAVMFGAATTGAILAILCPNEWLRRNKPIIDKSVSDVPVGSTATYLSGPVSSAIVIIAASLFFEHAGNVAEAQSRLTESGQSTAGELQPTDVILASDDPLALPVLYVHRTMIEQYRQRQQKAGQPFEYLITSAAYSAVVGQDLTSQIQARYRIAVPRQSNQIDVRLPISGAALGGDPVCTVNDKPHPIFLSEQSDGFRLTLPASHDSEVLQAPLPAETTPANTDDRLSADSDVAYYDIVLQLRPVSKLGNSSNGFHIGIPPVSASRLHLTLPQTFEKVEVSSAYGQIDHQRASTLLTADLGRTDRLEVEWLTASAMETNTVHVNLNAEGQAWIRPSLIDYLYRIRCDIVSGEVNYLTWELPENSVLRQAKINSANAHHVVSIYNDKPLLILEFLEPQTDDFVIELEFRTPSAIQKDAGEIPLVDWGNIKNTATDAGEVKVEVDNRSHRIGLVTNTEFDIAIAQENIAGLSAISPNAFLTEENRDTGFRKPLLAYEVNSLNQLPFTIQPRATTRKVWSQQVGVLHKREMTWRFNAEVKTSGPGAFQHHIAVNRNLRLERLSVKEDGVERPGRWSRNGDRLTLFLADKTTGTQDIVIEGRISLPSGKSVALPLMFIEDSETIESFVDLQHRPGVVVKTDFPDYFVSRQRSAALATTNSSHFVQGSYRIDNPDNARSAAVKPRVQLLNRSDQVKWDSLTQLVPVSNGQWNIETFIRFHDMTMDASEFHIHVPTDMVDRLQIEPADLAGPFEQSEGGVSTLTLHRDENSANDLQVRISSTITGPTGDWVLPAIGADYAADGKHYLRIPRPSDYRPGGSQPRPVASVDLPGWISEELNRQTADNSENFSDMVMFSSPLSNWTLAAQQRVIQPVDPYVSLLDTTFWVGNDDVDYAQTNLIVKAYANCAVEFHWPEAETIEFQGLFLDGIPQSLSESAAVPDQIQVEESTLFRTVSLLWSFKRDHTLSSFGSWKLRVPTVRNLRTETSLVSVVPAANSQVYSSTGERSLSSWEYGINVLASYVSDPNEIRVATADDVLRIQQLVAFRDRLEEQQAQFKDSEAPARPTTAQLARFRKVSAQIDRLQKESQDIDTTMGMLLDVDKSAYNSFLLHPQLEGVHSQISTQQESAFPAVWVINRRLVSWLFWLAGVGIATPILMRLLRTSSVRWLQRHRLGGLILLSVFWWIFFSASVVGILLFIYAAVSIGLQYRKRNQPQSRQIQRA